MNFIYVIHLMCWNYLIDLITDNRNRNSKNRINSGDVNKGGRARIERPVLLSLLPILFLLLLLCVIRWLQYNMWMTYMKFIN